MALKKHQLQSALFVSCQYLDVARISPRLPLWEKAGHLIANHTYSHNNYHQVPFKEFAADILRCHHMLKDKTGFKPLFRFPMLKGGDTKEKRDEMQKFLKELGYKNGYVSIDTSDWYISERLSTKLKTNPKIDLNLYRTYYLNHMWERAQFYDGLAKKHWKKPAKHTLLIHHNILNAYFLDDLIQMFKDKGWKLVDARTAFEDPIYSLLPNILPAGESIIWSIAKENGHEGLRQPGEDSEYEKTSMDKLGL